MIFKIKLPNFAPRNKDSDYEIANSSMVPIHAHKDSDCI